jgi:predicted amidohydrolase YtcJ
MCFFLAFTLACEYRSQTPADLVLRGGKVVTLNPDRPVAEAIAVTGERITAVGSTEEVDEYIGPETRVIELGGTLAVPGLIESHAHFMDLGLSHMKLDLFGTKSAEEIAGLVSATAQNTPNEVWIQGHGWDQNDWDVKEFPTHAALDDVCPDHPVYLTRVDLHAGWANAKAMELAGVTPEAIDPDGGEIVRDEEGKPTGIFIDNAMSLITDRIPPPSEGERVEAFRRAQAACLENGITSFHDAGVDQATIDLYRKADGEGDLKVRIYAMIWGSDATLLGQYFSHKPILSPHLTIRSVKLLVDGALGSRGAAMLDDYSDRPEWKGLMILSEDDIYQISDRALKAGYQVAAHAIGDRANRETLNAFEKAFSNNSHVPDPRFRIEHAQILDQADIRRFAQLGVVAAMQGVHATSDMPWVAERIGEERTAEGAYVWAKLLGSGVRIANGTDAPVESLSALDCFYASITRQDKDGEPDDGWYPEHRMSRQQALRSYTLDAAYAAFEENEKGSIQTGKLADITVVSKDIMTIQPREILSTEVLYTIIGGEVVFQKETAEPSPTDGAP